MVTNEDIPDKVIIEYLKKDKAKLLRQIKNLKKEIAKKDEAIKAFKKWQTRMVHYKWNYWFHEAKKLVDEIPDQETLNATFKMLDSMDRYKKYKKRIENAHQCMLAAKIYIEEHKEDDKDS